MIKLYNTLTRSIEEFQPINPSKVGLYTCGPTVYSTAHLGNLRTYIFEDLLRRTLEFNGLKVKHVMNITDVGHLTSDADEGEDKVEQAARQQQRQAMDIAREHETEFFRDLERLNILQPTTILRATDTIDLQIELIRQLENKEFTYRTSDGLYFDTGKFPTYGQLSRQPLTEKKAGARVKVNPEKHRPTDFALWKFSPADAKRQLEWPSPWGKGFPGWHIECSAMSMHELGEQFDIHCGGIDHIPVHHENEIAQSEAATGKHPFVKYWMHGEFMDISPLEASGNKFINNIHVCSNCGHENLVKSNKGYITREANDWILLVVKCKKCKKEFGAGIKMSKSLKNEITLEDILTRNIHPLAFRYLVLQTHYRSKLVFSWEALEAASQGLYRLWLLIDTEAQTPKIGCAEFEQRFREAVNDDLDTPKAMAIMHEMLKSDYPWSAKLQSLAVFEQVLGLGLSQDAPRDHFRPLGEVVVKQIESLIRDREAARQRQDWPHADELRQQINSLLKPFSRTLEDTPSGPEIRPRAAR